MFILFHWSICPSLCQYHTVLIYCSFQIGFEIRNYEILTFVVSQDGFNYSKILGYSIRNFRMNISISENERKVLVTQSCLVLCNLMDSSPPGFSVHGILQARILQWVAIPFSRGSSQPRYRTQASPIAGRFFV